MKCYDYCGKPNPDSAGKLKNCYMRIYTKELIEATRGLRVALENERDTRTGLAAVAADELVRDFMPLLAKINRYADAAKNEVDLD